MHAAQRQPVRNWPGFSAARRHDAGRLDALRKRARHRAETGADMELLAGDVQEPAALAQNDELGRQLTCALARLPGQQAEIYCLRHLNELSYERIAAELGITVDRVGVDLHRAQSAFARDAQSAFCKSNGSRSIMTNTHPTLEQEPDDVLQRAAASLRAQTAAAVPPLSVVTQTIHALEALRPHRQTGEITS